MKKNIVALGLLGILFSILYPPYWTIVNRPGVTKYIVDSGWGLIWNLKAEESVTGNHYWTYQKIRFDILICEIFAIITLPGIFTLVEKKKKKNENLYYSIL